MPPEKVKNYLSRMSGKLSRTVLRRGKGSNPFSLVEFTCDDYINLLKENNIKVSMDGKGRALDNQRIERFFRSYKWEKLYLEEYETGLQLKKITNEYVEHYNNKRPHQSLEYMTPSDYYYGRARILTAVV